VVYACVTCFSVKQLRALLDAFLKMKRGSRLALMDKELADFLLSADGEEEKVRDISKSGSASSASAKAAFVSHALVADTWALTDTLKCATTWGSGTVYLYTKVM
jgi:hypothetical protein